MSEADHEKLGDNERRIALRADELVEAKLETFEDNLDKVRLPELVMTAGVYRDKIFKRQEHRQPTAQATNVLIVVNAQKPETIEGEVVRDAEDQDGPGGVPVPSG